jgi:thioredoxin reductase (NADPH)
MAIPVEVTRLDYAKTPPALELADGRQVRASTMVVASGARYRRPDIPHLKEFEGRGIWYWASPIEARLCRQEEIMLVGGGNSAGQAAVFLSGYASKIWILVRGPGLSESISRYLIHRIAATPNIEVLTHTEVVALSGATEKQLERVRWRNNKTGEESDKPIRNVFLFIGAEPATQWLKDCGVALDAKGFVLTGKSVAPDEFRSDGRPEPMALESSMPGVFAIGDVRAGSVKRVGAAIGEGAAVVPQLHRFLAEPQAVAPPEANQTAAAPSRAA